MGFQSFDVTSKCFFGLVFLDHAVPVEVKTALVEIAEKYDRGNSQLCSCMIWHCITAHTLLYIPMWHEYIMYTYIYIYIYIHTHASTMTYRNIGLSVHIYIWSYTMYTNLLYNTIPGFTRCKWFLHIFTLSYSGSRIWLGGKSCSWKGKSSFAYAGSSARSDHKGDTKVQPQREARWTFVPNIQIQHS